MNKINFIRLGFNRAAEFLIQKGANVNVIGQDNQTALTWAAFKGSKSLVELLLENGAVTTINAVNNRKNSALILSIDSGRGNY